MIAKDMIFINPTILRSLNKSKLRKKILFFLYKIHPQGVYLSELSRWVNSDPSNVLGCLKGMGTRYNGNYSLIEMGLVECIDEAGMKIYVITKYGKNIVEYLKDYDSIDRW
ncbi:helix-turn-helix domain-containing protein [Methanothermococcus sp.]|uniref:helix-turn-helix domain-containing protein n=1 Tax=Methanothermococcus sp. TaxID=2614238 RepID=UPI0025FBEFB3|nr:archaellum operon transcriptional activator EarA family protein [Methanothermococcus sp.]